MLNADKDKQKSNFFYRNSTPILPKNLSTTNNKQSLPIKSSKKSLNVIEFIKDKNKFCIKNLFDENGAEKFLKSKEIALMEIKLNDEIICVNNKKKSLRLIKSSNTNENSINIINKSANENRGEYCLKKINKSSNLNIDDNSLKFINKSGNEDGNEYGAKITIKSANLEEKNDKDDKYRISPKIRRGKTINQNKKRKKVKKIRQNKTDKKKSKNKNIDNLYDNNMNIKAKDKKSNSHDSNSSHHLYKFIIDNANESEDIFNEKLEKEMKRFQTKRLNSKNYNNNNNNNNYIKTSTNKKSTNGDKPKNLRQCMTNKGTRKSIFNFSQNAKALMESNDFELSSINDRTMQNKNESNFFKIIESTRKKEINNKGTFDDEKKEHDDNIEINSENHSLMSILSGLM